LKANIMAKELLPILLSTAVWGPQLRGHQVLFQCDNSSVVSAVNKGSTRDAVVRLHIPMNLMHLFEYGNLD